MEGLVGPRLLRHGGAEILTSSLPAGSVVALYFSAHWCGPCKAYTPDLRKVYERCKGQGKAFEVIFVSGDHDEASFSQYFATMPWLAVPYADRVRQQTLSMGFGVRGIPSLVLLTGSGSLLDASGRSKVMHPGFPSTLPRVIDLEDIGPLPTGPTPIRLRCQGKTYDIECDPEEGWDLLQLQIFSITGVPSEQQRLFGLGVPRGPLSMAVPLPRALARGLVAGKDLGNEVVADVPDAARQASSVHDGDAVGTGHHRGRLDSPQGWSAGQDDQAMRDLAVWYQMDVGTVRPVSGVCIRPRHDQPQRVTKFKVAVAQTDNGPWTFVKDGAELVGNESNLERDRRVLFPEVLETRFVRIYVIAYAGHKSLRADILVPGDAAASKQDAGASLAPEIVVLGNASAGDPFEFANSQKTDDASAKLMQEQHLAFLQAKLSTAPPRLQSQVNNFAHVLKYEDLDLQRHALDQVPVHLLDQHVAVSSSTSGYEIALMRQVLRWFKFDFFTWTNAPRCEHCLSRRTKTIGATAPNQVEQSFLAGNVEVYQCDDCGLQTRFPRYNDPAKLLETRTGRCGEWANCFTLVCRSLGYEARHVHDWTDHVWTEVYSDSLGRWLHADSCEMALDSPLMYEQGWGKKLSYCLAFARDHVCDVTKRYTQKYDEVLGRRTQFSEQQLSLVMRAIGEYAIEQYAGKLLTEVAEARREVLVARQDREGKELAEGGISQPKAEELVGRTSGDKEWREHRGELGATKQARDQAIQRSDAGVGDMTQGSSGAPPAAPPVALSKEELQALVKAKFAELVAAGVPANEAAAKAVEQAKQQASRPPSRASASE